MEIISFLDLRTTHVTLPPAGQGASGGPYTVATNAARLCLFFFRIKKQYKEQ